MPTVTTSIGTDSRDYATITAWEADLDNGAVYSSGDDAVGECYNDSAFDESVTLDGGGTLGLSSVTLTVAEGERHDGTAGTGARIAAASTARTITTANSDFPSYRVAWLEIDGNGLASSGLVQIVGFSGTARIADHLVVHGAGNTNDPMILGRASNTGGTAHNNLVYHMRSSFSGGATGVSVEIAYNNTVHDIQATRPAGANAEGILGGEAKNNVVTGTATLSGTAVDFSSITTESHNASSDATAGGTGSLTNLDPADLYVSTVEGSEDLHLKAGADVIDAGTDLSATGIADIELDIDGEARSGDWDIGADELAAAPGDISWLSEPPSLHRPVWQAVPYR